MSAHRVPGDHNGNGVPDVLEKKRTSSIGDRNGNGVPDVLEKNRKSSIGDRNGNGIPDVLENRNRSASGDRNGNGIPDRFEGVNTIGTTHATQVMLPTKIIEKPAAIHEEIRREQVEEIQPIINVEKLKTEVHQVTQPLYDREVKAVGVSQVTLASQQLPQVNMPNVGMRAATDQSTVVYRDSAQVVEKPAMYMETQRTQIIEEIQPVIYKETIVPTLIKETKPIYQTVVEGTTYTHTTLPAKQLHGSVYANTTFVSATDMNGNGIPDSMERRSGDMNHNGIPDSMERRTQGNVFDKNGNGIPDVLERRTGDANHNGIPDSMERRSGNPLDKNGNGVPDVLERRHQ